MPKLLRFFMAAVCLLATSLPVRAAESANPVKVSKERLVLMPLRLSDEDKNLSGAMETALVEGLQNKFEVFSGEQVSKKAREIFLKESRNTAKKECDETRCMKDIAVAFQAELIATPQVTKRDGGYFLALSIQNIFDNKVMYSRSVPCEGCTTFALIDKLKELSGAPAQAAPTTAIFPENRQKTKASDPETALWNEVQKGNSADDYAVYIAQYPNGTYAALAKSRYKKIKSEAVATQPGQQLNMSPTGAAATADKYQDKPKDRRRILTPLERERLAKFKKRIAEQEAAQGVQSNRTSSQLNTEQRERDRPLRPIIRELEKRRE